MNCSDYQNLLSEYIDSELHETKRADMNSHLQICVECYEVYQDLSRIVSASRELPLLASGNHLWVHIEREIKQLTAEHLPKKPSLWERFWSYKLQMKLSMPQLAAGAMGFMVLLALTATVSYRPERLTNQDLSMKPANANTVMARPLADVMNPEEVEIRGAIERLTMAVEQRKSKWDPKMKELFDRNLEIVDRSIAECRQMTLRSPNDEVAREILITAYREKLRLLEQFSSL